MKAIRLAILALLRDGKSGELRVLLFALLVAVSALTAVGFFTSRVSRAVDQQAGEGLDYEGKHRRLLRTILATAPKTVIPEQSGDDEGL